MKHGLKISDDELLDNLKFAMIRENLRLEASGFGASERDKYLETQYWNAPQSAFSNLKVCWDYRPLANRLNLEASDDDLRTFSLYECEAEQLFSLLADSQHFQFHSVFQEAEKNLFLRVVGHWECGAALTPPILKLLKNGRFRKIDGFHR